MSKHHLAGRKRIEQELASGVPELALTPLAISSDTMVTDHSLILVDTSGGAVTVTLGSALLSAGKVVRIVDDAGNASGNAITVQTEGSATIEPDGTSSKTIGVDYAELRLAPNDGANHWQALNRNVERESINTADLDGDYVGKIRVFEDGSVIGTVDPSDTTTPVQDALDQIPGAGAVELPPGEITEEATINWPSQVDLKTYGGYDTALIDMSNVTGQLMVFDNLSNCHFEPFKLLGPGDGAAATDALVFQTSTVSKCTFEGVSIRDIYGRAISVQDAGHYQIDIGVLFLNNVDAGDVEAAIHFGTGGGPSWTFHEIWAYPSAATSAANSTVLRVESTSSASLRVGDANIGGSAGVFGMFNTVGQSAYVGPINYEPNNQQSTPRAIIVDQTGGKATTFAGPITLNGNGGGTADAAVEPQSSGNIFIGLTSDINGSVFSTADVNVTADYGSAAFPIMYAGGSARVANNSGSALTMGVTCLGDGVRKFSTGTGATGGADDQLIMPRTDLGYTVSNLSSDRALDANNDTLDQVADVLGTLIADLQSAGVIGS